MSDKETPEYADLEPEGGEFGEEHDAEDLFYNESFADLLGDEVDESADSPEPDFGDGEFGDDDQFDNLADLFEDDFEAAIPLPRRQPAASASVLEAYELMKFLARKAGQAEDGLEAQAYVAAMGAPALQLVPHVYRALWPVLPVMIVTTSRFTRRVHRSSRRGHFYKGLPKALSRTVHRLAKAITAGRQPSATQIQQLLRSEFLRLMPAQAKKRQRHHNGNYFDW